MSAAQSLLRAYGFRNGSGSFATLAAIRRASTDHGGRKRRGGFAIRAKTSGAAGTAIVG
jgi:hypothetical protein